MITGTSENRACYLAAADAHFRFADAPTICDGVGAFLYCVDDAARAESLVELYRAECQTRDFELAVVAAQGLTAHQIVLVNREISRSESIANNLGSPDYRTSDPIFAAIGQCSATLTRLDVELRHVLENAAKTVAPDLRADAYSARHRLLPPIDPPHSLVEAFGTLTYVLERHRLMFLHFAGAVRRNPSAMSGPTGIYERVRFQDIREHKVYLAQIDSDGEFLFKNRWFLNNYVDEAISRFGAGEGHKPDVEGATHPYWVLEESGVGYLQDSSDAIHTCAAWLRGFDHHGECTALINNCLEVAYDAGKSRWYSSIVTRWQYIAELDNAIAAVKRTAVLQQLPGVAQAAATQTEEAWFYLRAAYDEAMFNHDPGSLGRVVGDPDYYPLENGTLTFFKVRGERMAQRLVRLFERGVKPFVETEGETRTRVSFSCNRVDSFDEDDIFLLDEEVSAARAQVELLDKQYAIETGPRLRGGKVVDPGDTSRERRPLSGEGLSYQRLYDQARRWWEKLTSDDSKTAEVHQPEETPAPVVATSAVEAPSTSDEPASAEMLRLALPTAVTALAGLRDLIRVRVYYPEVIPESEAKSLHNQLIAELKSALVICKLERILTVTTLPSAEQIGSDVEISALLGMLTLHHPDLPTDPASSDSLTSNMEAAFAICQRDVMGPVRGIVERVLQAMLYDCRVPSPKGEESFQEPQRFLQMLRIYWSIVRKLALHHIDAPFGYQPHPLLPLVENLKARIDACFEKLSQLNGVDDVRQQVAMLIDIVLSGEPEELTAVPEWSFGQITGVDRFIEEARLSLGAKSYPLTNAEDLCVSQANKAVEDYEQQVKSHWSKMLKRIDAQHGANATASKIAPDQTGPNGPPLDEKQSQSNAEQVELKPFIGGAMVYFSNRVEFCGVEICRGSRAEARRRILNLLKTQRAGKFAAYSGEELAIAAEIKGGAVAAAGAIKELRDDIIETLRSLNIAAGRTDVIVTDRSGYHFASCVSIQEGELTAATTNADTANETDVRIVRNGDVRNVPNDVRIPDDTPDPRVQWILQQLEAGHQLKGPDVMREFSCSDKTALRILGALKDVGKIEFVGSTRTGFYRLCQPPKARGD